MIVIILAIVMITVAVLWVSARKKRKARQCAMQILKKKGSVVFVVRAQDVLPESQLSKLVDSPEGLPVIAAVLGVAFMYLYYVLIIGFPPITAVAGLLLALAPKYIVLIFSRVLEVRAITQTLQVINILSSLLQAPNATLSSVTDKLEHLCVDEWTKQTFKETVTGHIVVFPSLPRVTNLWGTISEALSGESITEAGDALGDMLRVQLSALDRVTRNVRSITGLLEQIAGFMLPAIVGLGLIIVLLSLIHGLPPITSIPTP